MLFASQLAAHDDDVDSDALHFVTDVLKDDDDDDANDSPSHQLSQEAKTSGIIDFGQLQINTGPDSGELHDETTETQTETHALVRSIAPDTAKASSGSWQNMIDSAFAPSAALPSGKGIEKVLMTSRSVVSPSARSTEGGQSPLPFIVTSCDVTIRSTASTPKSTQVIIDPKAGVPLVPVTSDSAMTVEDMLVAQQPAGIVECVSYVQLLAWYASNNPARLDAMQSAHPLLTNGRAFTDELPSPSNNAGGNAATATFCSAPVDFAATSEVSDVFVGQLPLFMTCQWLHIVLEFLVRKPGCVRHVWLPPSTKAPQSATPYAMIGLVDPADFALFKSLDGRAFFGRTHLFFTSDTARQPTFALVVARVVGIDAERPSSKRDPHLSRSCLVVSSTSARGNNKKAKMTAAAKRNGEQPRGTETARHPQRRDSRSSGGPTLPPPYVPPASAGFVSNNLAWLPHAASQAMPTMQGSMTPTYSGMMAASMQQAPTMMWVAPAPMYYPAPTNFAPSPFVVGPGHGVATAPSSYYPSYPYYGGGAAQPPTASLPPTPVSASNGTPTGSAVNR